MNLNAVQESILLRMICKPCLLNGPFTAHTVRCIYDDVIIELVFHLIIRMQGLDPFKV